MMNDLFYMEINERISKILFMLKYANLSNFQNMKERLTDLSIQNSSGFPIKKEIVSFFASKVNTQSVFKKALYT